MQQWKEMQPHVEPIPMGPSRRPAAFVEGRRFILAGGAYEGQKPRSVFALDLDNSTWSALGDLGEDGGMAYTMGRMQARIMWRN